MVLRAPRGYPAVSYTKDCRGCIRVAMHIGPRPIGMNGHVTLVPAAGWRFRIHAPSAVAEDGDNHDGDAGHDPDTDASVAPCDMTDLHQAIPRTVPQSPALQNRTWCPVQPQHHRRQSQRNHGLSQPPAFGGNPVKQQQAQHRPAANLLMITKHPKAKGTERCCDRSD